MHTAVLVENTLHALQISGTCFIDAVLRLHLLTLILELVMTSSKCPTLFECRMFRQPRLAITQFFELVLTFKLGIGLILCRNVVVQIWSGCGQW